MKRLLMEKFIEELPGEGGWWKQRGKHEFEHIAHTLSGLGVDDETIRTILQDAYEAVAEQFGH